MSHQIPTGYLLFAYEALEQKTAWNRGPGGIAKKVFPSPGIIARPQRRVEAAR